MDRTDETFCTQWGICGGCPWGGRPLEVQREEKLKAVRHLFPDVTFASTPALHLRDRVDLVWESGRLGLYGLNKREVVDLERCPLLSPELEHFLLAYRERKPPIGKGSVRLRVSPSGERGVWLDFANQDVKTLFEEREYLRWLSQLAFVEIGQKRKHLIWRDSAPKLIDAELRPWFASDDGAKPLPLFGPVGGFSQTGLVGNRALVAEVCKAVAQSGVREWLELFAGNGNLALALAARGFSLEAIELDALAVRGMELSLEGRPDLPLRVQRGDVYLKTGALPPLLGRGLLVDPPRAGLRQVLDWIEKGEKPRALVYVSCFTEVFVSEAERLLALGYKLRQLSGVDQFPHSPHAEWIALFSFDPAGS